VTESPGHIEPLDGLRALAVTGVLVHHFGSGRFELGTYGVLLFFVISGFLITGILLRIKNYVASGALTVGTGLRIFYIRRFLRIFPVYYLLLAALFMLDVPGVRQHIAWQGFYATNVWVAIHHRFEEATGPFWSLAVEEQFYLIWPLLILLLPIRFLRPMAWSLAIFAVAFRAFGTLLFHFDPLTTNTLLPGSLDSLSLGALLAIGTDSVWLRRSGLVATLLVVAEICLELMGKGVKLRLATLNLFCVLSAVAAVGYAVEMPDSAWGRILSWKMLTYIGTISYGIYLYHMPLNVLSGMSGLHTAVLTLIVATLSWYLFEKPINRLKDRFPYLRIRANPVPVAESLVTAV
jgi:peptidoglycan/LPS O-acetylase OafA/YrhL